MSKLLTAEQKAIASFIAVGATPCHSFAPHAPDYYMDKLGHHSKCRPDFHIYHEGENKFFEFKAHPLNRKGSKKTCLTALRTQYEYRFRRSSGSMSHDAISAELWNAGHRLDCLKNAWNHSINKHLIIQKVLGRESYIVVFNNKPLPDDIAYYRRKGLHWTTIECLHLLFPPDKLP